MAVSTDSPVVPKQYFIVESGHDGAQCLLIDSEGLLSAVHEQFCMCTNPDGCQDENYGTLKELIGIEDEWKANSLTMDLEDGYVTVYRLTKEPEMLATKEMLIGIQAREIESLKRQLKQMIQDAKEDAKAAASESRWLERLGSDFGGF